MTGYAADHRPATIRALIIAVDRQWTVAEIRTDLRTYQEIVQAFVTIYDPSKDWRICCDDATGMDRPPPSTRVNRLATELAVWADLLFGKAILGTAVIVGVDPSGHDTSVPNSLIRHFEGARQSAF